MDSRRRRGRTQRWAKQLCWMERGSAPSRDLSGYDRGDDKDSLWSGGGARQVPEGLRKKAAGEDDEDKKNQPNQGGGSREGSGGGGDEGRNNGAVNMRDKAAINDWLNDAQLSSMEASGIGGIRPDDHFAISVLTSHPTSNLGSPAARLPVLEHPECKASKLRDLIRTLKQQCGQLLQSTIVSETLLPLEPSQLPPPSELLIDSDSDSDCDSTDTAEHEIFSLINGKPVDQWRANRTHDETDEDDNDTYDDKDDYDLMDDICEKNLRRAITIGYEDMEEDGKGLCWDCLWCGSMINIDDFSNNSTGLEFKACCESMVNGQKAKRARDFAKSCEVAKDGVEQFDGARAVDTVSLMQERGSYGGEDIWSVSSEEGEALVEDVQRLDIASQAVMAELYENPW